MRGYGYDNRTNYDAYYSPGSPLLDTRKLYSQSWDAGLRYNGEMIKSQLITSYSHSKDYNYDPHYGRYDSSATLDEMKQYTVQWANNVTVGHGNIGAGVDWQKQTTTPGTGYVEDGYDQRNTGIYLTGLQQVGDFTFEGAARSDDNSQFGRHGTRQTSAGWEFIEGYRFIASYGTSYKAPNLGQLYGFYGNPNLNPEKSKQWEGAFEGLTAGVNWRISGYRNDVSDLIDCDDHTLKYYNEGKARIKGVEATANFDTGPLTHTVSYDYVDARNAITDTPLLRRAKQQVKYQLDWQLYDFDWGITYQYLGTRYDKDYSSYPYQTVKMGGVSLWDLAVAYPVTSHLTVRGKIANLFDKDYETVYGYQTAGREYTLSGSYTFWNHVPPCWCLTPASVGCRSMTRSGISYRISITFMLSITSLSRMAKKAKRLLLSEWWQLSPQCKNVIPLRWLWSLATLPVPFHFLHYAKSSTSRLLVSCRRLNLLHV